MADKRLQKGLISITRRHLKKYKRARKLKAAGGKADVRGGSGISFANDPQEGPA